MRHWRQARVFISSTFRDMHGERDALTRTVFPELQERCNALRVRATPVDLRCALHSCFCFVEHQKMEQLTNRFSLPGGGSPKTRRRRRWDSAFLRSTHAGRSSCRCLARATAGARSIRTTLLQLQAAKATPTTSAVQRGSLRSLRGSP